MIMLRYFLSFGLLLACLAIFGCDKKTSNTPTAQDGSVKKESLQEKVDRLQRELSVLKFQVGSLSDGSAYVSTEEKGYSIAQTKYGAFAIVCKNVTPYLDGYKVHLSIGNLTNARFNGGKISFLWGKDFNSKEINVTNSFLPGRYTNVEAVLTPAKPEDIKTFSLTLDFNNMALY